MNRRIIAMLIACALLLALVPSAALADGVAKRTVYLTVATNSVPVVTPLDGTPAARLKMTVPYFDLALYGLEKFYRLEAESFANGGAYKEDGKLIEIPTVLHAFIYATERYYLGLDEDDCGKGALKPYMGVYDGYDCIEPAAEGSYTTLFGDTGSVSSWDGNAPMFAFGGSPTSGWVKGFWGLTENLMYGVNGMSAFMAQNKNASADYILLENGMEITVAHSDNWDFYNTGYYGALDHDSYSALVGQPMTVKVTGINYGLCMNMDGTPMEWVDLSNQYIMAIDANHKGTITSTPVFMGMTDGSGEATITFTQPGTYKIITLDEYYGDYNASGTSPAVATVYVKEAAVPATGMSLNATARAMGPGEVYKLEPTFTPEDATITSVTWTTSKADVVYVNTDGTLYGKGEGEATVTCTAVDNSGNTLTATCAVTCSANKPVHSVELTPSTLEMNVGDTYELGKGVVVKPDDANNKTFTFKSSDASIVSVGQFGKLTANAPGTATITVTTADGGYTDECVVTVTGGAAVVPGDLNGDGSVTVQDVQAMFAIALGGTAPEGFDEAFADVYGDDGVVTVQDVQYAFALALAGN